MVSTDRIKIIKDQAMTGFYELMITNVMPEDAGKYTATSANRYGEISCEGNITVTSKPLKFSESFGFLFGEKVDDAIRFSICGR